MVEVQDAALNCLCVKIVFWNIDKHTTQKKRNEVTLVGKREETKEKQEEMKTKEMKNIFKKTTALKK